MDIHHESTDLDHPVGDLPHHHAPETSANGRQHYLLKGQKIFAGDHDMTDNIVHLVQRRPGPL